MRKSSLVLTALIAVVTMLFSFTKEKENVYKNLKVLPKNTDKHQMDSTMKSFTASLGVKCTFCHVRLDNEKKDFNFASDDKKEKNTARYMMKMTIKINKKFFKDAKDENDVAVINEITCYSCHNGKEHPGRIPPMPQRPDGPRPPEQPKP